jgi:hypothetical protein
MTPEAAFSASPHPQRGQVIRDVIPLDASLVRGSHGRITDRPEEGPLLIASRGDLLARDKVAATDVKSLLLNAVFR